MNVIEEACKAIEAQQSEKRDSVWMVGEQLKEMIRTDGDAAALVLEDLRSGGERTLQKAEEQIRKRAQENRIGTVGCVTPVEAEEILRHFFGLGERQSAEQKHTGETRILMLEDFL